MKYPIDSLSLGGCGRTLDSQLLHSCSSGGLHILSNVAASCFREATQKKQKTKQTNSNNINRKEKKTAKIALKKYITTNRQTGRNAAAVLPPAVEQPEEFV